MTTHVGARIAAARQAAITDSRLRDLPLIGSVDQLADSTDVLSNIDVARRLGAVCFGFQPPRRAG